jgi:hypothetical protein
MLSFQLTGSLVGSKCPVWWFIDSGCNIHMVKWPEYFIEELTQDDTSRVVYMHMNYNDRYFIPDTVGSVLWGTLMETLSLSRAYGCSLWLQRKWFSVGVVLEMIR